jgi:hypothetical protein
LASIIGARCVCLGRPRIAPFVAPLGALRVLRFSAMNFRRILFVSLLTTGLGIAVSARAEIKLSASEPVLLTSAGQSADVQILKTLFDRSKVAAKTLPLAKPADLEGMKALVVAVGGSAKGLGAAGIDAEKETARLKSLLARARELKIPVLAMHIGGEAKRGDLSDALFSLVAAAAAQIVIIKDGDKDGFLTKTAAAHKVPLHSVEKLVAVMEPIKIVFRK